MASVFDQMLSRYEITTTRDRQNALREVMHLVALSGLHRAGFFDKAAFYGGTCLRIFHKLPRFSEDMDFSLLKPDDSFTLEDYFEPLQNEFGLFGRKIQIQVKKKSMDIQIESAFLKDNTELVNLKFQTERSVKIKIEVDKNPPMGFTTEFRLQLLPYSFMTRCFDLPGLFAGKMHALLFRGWKSRVKGRDWYDFEWYIKNGYSLDFNHLKERSIQSGHRGEREFSEDIFMELLKEKIGTTSFEKAREDVKPFIKHHEELDIWSAEYFQQLSDMIRIV